MKKPYLVYSKEAPLQVIDYYESGFYPAERLRGGLKTVIVFPENDRKHEIPIGSVWVYDKRTDFNPDILKGDVGCGMTMGIIKGDIPDEALAEKIFNILIKNDIKIGRGNHFIDLLTAHFQFPEDTSTIVVHSHYSLENDNPSDYTSAIKHMQQGLDSRRRILEIIFSDPEITGVIYKDWTHNSVEMTNDNLIYRKGAFDLKKTDGEGLLALNPYDGLYSYAGSNFKKFDSMPHAIGRKNTDLKADFSKIKKLFKEGKYECWDIRASERPAGLDEEYKSGKDFLSIFWSNFRLFDSKQTFLKPKYVFYTG